MTFEMLQERLLKVLVQAGAKVGSKQGELLESVYIQALCDSDVKLSAGLDMWIMSGRSVAGYNPPTKEVLAKYKNVQLTGTVVKGTCTSWS